MILARDGGVSGTGCPTYVLLDEITLSIAGGDLPIGCALTVDGELVDSDHNTVHSQKGLLFHAERNLLRRLAETAIPTGRRVLWVTLEPCLRCAQAIQRFGVDEVVYVLDDPFGGGKALLAQAGIKLTKREDWEFAILQRVMDSFALYPELCAGRWFPLFLDAWQRHRPVGHDDQVSSVFSHHLAPYLRAVLLRVPETRQAEIRRLFLAHVELLASLTLRECAGTPSVGFVRNLHRALFPPDYRHRAVGEDGAASETASGEWRKHVVPPRYTGFSAPEAIEADLSALLRGLSGKTSWRREDALRFYFDFTSVRPFADGNGRLAAILADVICLNHGLAPLAPDGKSELFYTALMQDLARGSPISDQLGLVDAWNRGQVEIDNVPSAFHTHVRRLGAKNLSFDETIEASLLPRLLHTLKKTPENEHERVISDFKTHVRLLSDYLRGEIVDGTLSINTAIGFHVRLYPPGSVIHAMDNHGSPDRPGNPVKISPGAWRQREIRDEPFRSHRWHSVCSPLSCIERDLGNVIAALNKIQEPRREDIFRFYFLFLKVHPFADSNGTTAAVLADALCARHGLAPLLPLNIRFKDKSFHWSVCEWSVCEAFDLVRSEQSLMNLLTEVDAFNQLFPIQGREAEAVCAGCSLS